jgi:hypothetical protein
MTEIIYFAKFMPTAGEEAPDTQINIDQPLPKFDTLTQAEFYYQDEAKHLVKILSECLPGGMMHALLVAMLENYHNYLRVKL